MNTIMFIIMIVAAVFASYKMAEENGQQKIVWAAVTALMGPMVVVVQYLYFYYRIKTSEQ
ncbi:hypothetical protein JCM1393_08690 [Clostridium carnis]